MESIKHKCAKIRHADDGHIVCKVCKKDYGMGMCDKCNEKPAQFPVPFIFNDMNDSEHQDVRDGYRQYWCCLGCIERERRISINLALHKKFRNDRLEEINIEGEQNRLG